VKGKQKKGLKRELRCKGEREKGKENGRDKNNLKKKPPPAIGSERKKKTKWHYG